MGALSARCQAIAARHLQTGRPAECEAAGRGGGVERSLAHAGGRLAHVLPQVRQVGAQVGQRPAQHMVHRSAHTAHHSEVPGSLRGSAPIAPSWLHGGSGPPPAGGLAKMGEKDGPGASPCHGGRSCSTAGRRRCGAGGLGSKQRFRGRVVLRTSRVGMRACAVAQPWGSARAAPALEQPGKPGPRGPPGPPGAGAVRCCHA